MRVCPFNEDELDKQDEIPHVERQSMSDIQKAELWQRMQELCEPNG